MSRFFFKLFSVVAAISLLIAIFIASAWLLSPIDFVRWGAGRGFVGISPDGAVDASLYGTAPVVGEMFRPSTGWKVGPVRYFYAPGMNTGQYAYHLRLPAWGLVLVFLILPALWYLLKRRRQRRNEYRRAQGLCVACGYDLRASTDRCPECGSLYGDGE
jgi:hypothetical protein